MIAYIIVIVALIYINLEGSPNLPLQRSITFFKKGLQVEGLFSCIPLECIVSWSLFWAGTSESTYCNPETAIISAVLLMARSTIGNFALEF